jgi:hypothetical protein
MDTRSSFGSRVWLRLTGERADVASWPLAVKAAPCHLAPQAPDACACPNAAGTGKEEWLGIVERAVVVPPAQSPNLA